VTCKGERSISRLYVNDLDQLIHMEAGCGERLAIRCKDHVAVADVA
jgi:hypothetical protein